MAVSQLQIREILYKYKVVAIVGLSDEAGKHSHQVAAYLKRCGYQIIPVNPTIQQVLGLKSYKSLLDIPPRLQRTIGIVDIFRRPEEVPAVVEQAIQLKAKVGHPFVIWMQLGIVNEEAAEAARRAGLVVVMNRCMMVERHQMP